MNKITDTTRLTSSVTGKQYLSYKANGDRTKIAGLIYERFFERYIAPFENNPAKHGFSMMAVSCLMIEGLFCFQRGRNQAGEAGKVVFEKFSSTSTELMEFKGCGDDFYHNVRCGILHQGETYAGWKIVRRGVLFDKLNKTINAAKFLAALKQELRNYTDCLRKEPFHGTTWKAAIKKLDHVCENCKHNKGVK